MFNNNGRPLTRRQTIRVFILLTILAWATQTLFHQWGFGQTVSGIAVDLAGDAKFVPVSNIGGATLEVRSEATVIGADVTLKQIARWNDADAKILAPISDLVVLRLSQGTPYRSITLDELRGLLSDAGVNMAIIRLSGATRCTVSRTDVHFDEGDALRKWIDARDPKSADKTANNAANNAVDKATDRATSPAAAPIDTPPTIAVAPAPADRKTNPEPLRTLRDTIIDDLATRLSLPADTLQVSFSAKDDRVLGLVEGTFKFSLEPLRARDLGSVIYDVTISNNGNSQKTTITAQARAWQQQLVVMKPVTFKQVLRDSDLQVRRTLIDRLNTDPMLALSQAVGMQAGRDLKPGTILTARLVDAVPLVHTGQLVTVTLTQGTVQLRSVARAMEGGTFGQPIQVKNETTGAIFEVVMTGPQTATMGGQEKPAADSVSLK